MVAENQHEKSEKPIWNSLEVAKLAIALLTPIVLLGISVFYNKWQASDSELRSLQRQKDEVVRQERYRIETEERERFVQVLKYRVELWRDISPLMNDVYCYFLYVGHWKELSPEAILRKKRELDKYVYPNRPFFTSQFMEKYNNFISAAFQTRNGWGMDATLKSQPIRATDRGKETMFDKQKDGQFSDNTTEIHRTYFEWLSFAGSEMKLQVATPVKPAQPSAAEINAGLDRGR